MEEHFVAESTKLAEIKVDKLKGKVYFITDAHLGSGCNSRERELQFCRLLDNIKGDCKTLMLLGDIFDFWFSYRYLVPRGHVRLLGKLAELSDSGVEIHFFIGNHDMWVFDYFTKEFGAIVHDDPVEVELYGKRFLIGHGDGLGHTDRWFDFVRVFFRSRFCHRLFKMLPSAFTFGIAHRWSDGNKRKHAKRDMLHYLGDGREGIVIYCKQRLEKEHFDYCVFGHRHTPLTRDLGNGCTYVNVGDWLHNRNYAVYGPEGVVELKNFDEA